MYCYFNKNAHCCLSAVDGVDYNGLMRQVLSFSPGVTRLCVNITILDDNVYEEQTNMFGVLLLPTDPVVTYRIKNANVSIINSNREFISIAIFEKLLVLYSLNFILWVA